jgi:hypothetical protein
MNDPMTLHFVSLIYQGTQLLNQFISFKQRCYIHDTSCKQLQSKLSLSMLEFPTLFVQIKRNLCASALPVDGNQMFDPLLLTNSWNCTTLVPLVRHLYYTYTNFYHEPHTTLVPHLYLTCTMYRTCTSLVPKQ